MNNTQDTFCLAKLEGQEGNQVNHKRDTWSLTDLIELEVYFDLVTLPTSVIMDDSIIITDPARFIDSYITILKQHEGQTMYTKYYFKLKKLQNIIEHERLHDHVQYM